MTNLENCNTDEKIRLNLVINELKSFFTLRCYLSTGKRINNYLCGLFITCEELWNLNTRHFYD
jgi:hypothetical protein